MFNIEDRPSSPAPSYHSGRADEADERNRLFAAFGGSDSGSDDGTDDEWDDDRNISLHEEDPEDPFYAAAPPAAPPVATSGGVGGSGGGANHESGETRRGTRFLGPFMNLFSRRSGANQRSSFSPGNGNDGVFANLSAKPSDGDSPVDENPPSYEEAAADATPPYWETTIMGAGGMSNELFIEGLPVGSPLNFAWNMLVSAAFQFVGFFLTYLLHTSHAAKNGSRAGLGFTLIQCGFYLTPDASAITPTEPPSEFEPNDPNDYDSHGRIAGTYVEAGPATGVPASATASDTVDPNSNWIANALMIVGGLILIKAVFDYWAARRMEQAIIDSHPPIVVVDDEEEEANPQASSPSPQPEPIPMPPMPHHSMV